MAIVGLQLFNLQHLTPEQSLQFNSIILIILQPAQKQRLVSVTSSIDSDVDGKLASRIFTHTSI